MTAQRGDDLVLKIGNAATPEIFTTIGGLRGTNLSFNSRPIDATHKGSGQWQDLMNNAGIKSVKIQANGAFTNSATETQIRQLAMSNELRNFQIAFGNGDSLQGSFKITSYNRSGTYRGEEVYDLSLESSGSISYIAG